MLLALVALDSGALAQQQESSQNAGQSAQAYPTVGSMPPTLRIPCTDDANTLPPGLSADGDYFGDTRFGRRKCTTVKHEIKDTLQRRISNVMAFYYSGKIIDFTDGVLEDEASHVNGGAMGASGSSGGHNGVGFCQVNTVLSPVCEMGRPDRGSAEQYNNHILVQGQTVGQDCAKKDYQDSKGTDDQCFKQRPVPMPQIDKNTPQSALPFQATPICGSQRAALANQEVKDLEQAAAALKASPWPWDQYRGKNIQKMLDDPDAFYTYMEGKWTQFKSSSRQYCAFTQSGVNLASCGVELAWLRGFRISIWQYYLEQVLHEVDQGVIALTPFGNYYPCGELALSIKYMLDGDDRYRDPLKTPFRPGIRALETRLKSVYDPIQQVTGTDPAEACLMYHGHEIQNSQEAALAISEAFSDSELGASSKEGKRISLAACNLAWARRETHQATAKLAYCEVMMRSKQDYYNKFMGSSQSASTLFQDFANNLAKPCFDWAYAQRSFWSCHAECVTNHFYACYDHGAGGEAVDSTGQPVTGVADWFYKYSRASYPYKTSPSIQRLVVQDLPNLPPGLKAGEVVPDDRVPMCTGASGGLIVPFIAARRRRRKPARAGRLRRAFEWLCLLGAPLVILFLASLGCDSDSATAPVSQVCLESGGVPSGHPTCDSSDSNCISQANDECGGQVDPYNGDDDEGADTELGSHQKVHDANDLQMEKNSGATIAQGQFKDPGAQPEDVQQSAATAANISLRKSKIGGGGGGGGGPGDAPRNGQTNFASGNGTVTTPNGGDDGSGGGVSVSSTGGSLGGGAAVGGRRPGSSSSDGFETAGAKAAGRSGPAVGENTTFDDHGAGAGSGGGSSDRVNGSGDVGGEGKIDESDQYWGKIGKGLTLFEVVSRRYAIFGNSIETPDRK